LYSITGQQSLDDAAVEMSSAKWKQDLARKQEERMRRVQDLVNTGMSRGQALYQVDHPGGGPPALPAAHGGASGDTHVQVLVQLDGMQIAAHTEKHIARRIRNHTVDGAAPTYRGD
ncbi:MAG TPA: hypothetical protein VJ891_10040, partial [Casimicrobiaceae bacterium]|nr:hypothetical protein [Casimicrobiaceae bacterium]